MNNGIVVAALSLATSFAGAQLQEPPATADDSMSIVHQEADNHAYMPVPPQPPRGAGPQETRIEYGPFVSVQVNVGQFGANILGDAANEPSLAIDPTDPDSIVVGWRQFDNILSDFRQAGYSFSTDGGATWSPIDVHQPGIFRSDPVLGVDPDGNFYYYSLSVPGGNFLCQSFKSSDGGMSWGPPVPAHGGDKAWMAVDSTTGIGRGNIYAKWQSFANCCGSSTFTRSIDGGGVFTSRVEVPLGPSFGVVDVGPDGAVYVAGIEYAGGQPQPFDEFAIARSDSAQDPRAAIEFEHSTLVDLGGVFAIGVDAGPNPAGLTGQVWVATDHSGGPTHNNVYMLCSVDPPGSDPMDVMFVRSEDGGVTWTPPIRVNDDSAAAWQWFGTISVAPTGRIDVVWNDTRDSGEVNLSVLYYAYSYDAGETWSMGIPVGPEFDSYLGWPQQDKLGDYYDMKSDVAGASLIYSATYNDEQDVYFLRLGDCNDNGVHDGLDITIGDSGDVNNNLIPDECEGLCRSVAECADINGDGVRDDNCVYWACESGACAGTAIVYADMGGQFGVCPPDGVADGNDSFQTLNCFADTSPDGNGPFECEPDPPFAFNVDAGGEFGACPSDGVCDGNDAFQALNAFGGATTCACPLDGGPAPVGRVVVDVVARARLRLVAGTRRLRAGEFLNVDVHLDTPLPDLRGFQLHLASEGGRSGRLELVDIAIRRGTALAAGLVERDGDQAAAEWQAFNRSTAQMVVGTSAPGTAVEPGYLATFTYRASPDARGRFVITLLDDLHDSTQRTYLFPTPSGALIDLAGSHPLTVEVAGHKR